MKPNTQDLDYLEGRELSSGYKFVYRTDWDARTRFAYITGMVKGKSVIHVGCADHIGLIREKIERGNWMHGAITEAASHCLGIDTNLEAIDFIQNEIGLDNVCKADLFDPSHERIAGRHWDYIVLGDILEHVDDPVSFLRNIRETYTGKAGNLIITVPNALYYKNFKWAYKGKEVINSDHRYWFTPYTLSKVITRAGFSVADVQCTQDFTLNFSPDISWLIMRYLPLLRSKVVATAAFPQD